MNVHTNKTTEYKKSLLANSNSPKLKSVGSALQFKDKRLASQKITQLKEVAHRKPNNTGLPIQLKSGIENLSGHSMDDVKVHYNSAKPAQLQAHAYAQGNQIHLGPGQEKHLPHEAWHVVQQKQGRVKPTMQMKGKVNINDNAGLEKEADVMGAKARDFLDQKNGSHLDFNKSQESVLQQKTNSNTIQLVSIPVSGGSFRAMGGRFVAINEDNSPNGFRKTGARMMLDFIPDDELDAQTVSLVQTVNDKTKVEGEPKPEREDARLSDREVTSGSGKGTAIDQVPYDGDELINRDPRYTENRMQENEPLSTKPPAFPPVLGTTGYAAHKAQGVFKPALLKDQPTITTAMTSAVRGGMEFEVAALAEGGQHGNKFVGSVKWGWRVTDGVAVLIPLSIVSHGSSSVTFMKAADKWNQQIFESSDGEDHEPMQLPLSKFYLTLKTLPIKQKKKMLLDKIKYNINYRKMLESKTGFAKGSSDKDIKKALATTNRMIRSDATEFITLMAKLNKLEGDSEAAAF